MVKNALKLRIKPLIAFCSAQNEEVQYLFILSGMKIVQIYDAIKLIMRNFRGAK